MTKDTAIRDRIVKVLKKAKARLSRAEIEYRLGTIPSDLKLPLSAMVREKLIVSTGKTRATRYSLPITSAA